MQPQPRKLLHKRINKKRLSKRGFHRDLLKLNFRIALSNEDKRLTEFSVSLLLLKKDMDKLYCSVDAFANKGNRYIYNLFERNPFPAVYPEFIYFKSCGAHKR